MLGQLALEASQGIYYEDEQLLGLSATILYEFYVDNAKAFQQPRDRSRKLRASVAMGILYYVQAERLRHDALWDANLLDFRSRLDQFVHPKATIKLH